MDINLTSLCSLQILGIFLAENASETIEATMYDVFMFKSVVFAWRKGRMSFFTDADIFACEFFIYLFEVKNSTQFQVLCLRPSCPQELSPMSDVSQKDLWHSALLHIVNVDANRRVHHQWFHYTGIISLQFIIASNYYCFVVSNLIAKPLIAGQFNSLTITFVF